MSHEAYPLVDLVKQLDQASGYEFQTLLKTLTSPVYINEQILKSELGLLNTKILKLLRSSDDFDVWKGCHTAVVICSYNPLVLCSHASQLLAAIYSKLEQKVGYYQSTISTMQGKTLLETLISSLSIIMDLMRNKPTVSREGLVPKLRAIIPTLITLSQDEPQLCLPVLQTLLKRNSTTFKPFVNKYRIVLSNLIVNHYHSFDKDTQTLICNNFAYLHLIKIQNAQSKGTDIDEAQSHHKSFSDDTWTSGLLNILYQFKPIIELCGELLDFKQDQDLQRIIESLPHSNVKSDDSDDDNESVHDFLPVLKLDMNAPLTLWQISNRLNLLVGLMNSFISLPTPFAIRIPIGGINAICETLLSMTTKYIPLKRELRRDQELNSIIHDIFPQIQLNGIHLWTNLIRSCNKCCIPLGSKILSNVELFIPLKNKSNLIDFERCYALKNEFGDVFKLINIVLPLMGHQFNEIDPIIKLINVALYLSEDKSLIDSIFNQQKELQSAAMKNNNNNSNNKKKNKRDQNVGALSDLYTHPEEFVITTSKEWYDETNQFFIMILNSLVLSSTQQTRIIKYSVSIALYLKSINDEIPRSFIDLIRCIVLHPGYEKVSILPIAVNILKDVNDEMFDLLCHPRLPTNMVYRVRNNNANVVEDEDEDEDDGRMIVDEETAANEADNVSLSLKMTEEKEKVVIMPHVERKVDIIEDETKIFKKRDIEDVQPEIEETTKRVKIVKEEEKVNNEVPVQVIDEKAFTSNIEDKDNGEDDNDDDSEFEIPVIDISDDEDEEE
ncbi:Rix1p NDAI_0D03330 [Naumovozyma dairenensis CBS 421]|uniref:Pre-rRNA-processing protein RIX1 n=1 Tax=Naumovozyma dairenensis (strain ATCC 10597 / BCRC 20456 / CBS 421 / NBRC 0211 / NRRL Y-12639) TaxID=1071378 RepID=G0WA36_NAUDC|nr:hypothetical protein NDAI_0D03330 [Naumovozyma dairenensis CBS 421]CCD24647.1 hypothetical protein NDAI_0D03330 [Naumovozyma dairenensis CBS 421]